MDESESHVEPTQNGDLRRRDFMRATILGIGGLISAGFALPAVAYIVGPALQQETEKWLELGPVAKVEMGVPTLFKTITQTQTGWITDEQEFSAYVLTDDGQTFIVLSNICTHLGCRVRWIAEQNGFFCPCHNGVFAKDGAVMSGPPPRPLDRFESKVEKNILYVKRG